jgi:hypothetical protein
LPGAGPLAHLLTCKYAGPLPLFRRTVLYADIAGVEVGRTLIPDGWGIHYSVRGA